MINLHENQQEMINLQMMLTTKKLSTYKIYIEFRFYK